MSKEVKRYELRIVDRYAGDGTGDIETDARMKQEAKGRYVLFSDYDALLAEWDALKEAAQRVLDGLNDRIDEASMLGGPVPVFEGIADLYDALQGEQP